MEGSKRRTQEERSQVEGPGARERSQALLPVYSARAAAGLERRGCGGSASLDFPGRSRASRALTWPPGSSAALYLGEEERSIEIVRTPSPSRLSRGAVW